MTMRKRVPKGEIVRAVQVAGRWYNPGDEAALLASAATKRTFEGWRIEGAVVGFKGAGARDAHETDAQMRKRQRPSPRSRP